MVTAKERSLAAMGKAKKSPVVKVTVNGEDIVLDAATLTGTERQMMKRSMANLGYPADEEDAFYTLIWVVMRRSDSSLTFANVCDAVTLTDVGTAVPVDASEDDSPQV